MVVKMHKLMTEETEVRRERLRKRERERERERERDRNIIMKSVIHFCRNSMELQSTC